MRVVRLLFFLLICSTMQAADWKAGVARLRITPKEPIWLSGYGNRNRPSEGVAQDLWAKALALQDPRGERVVIVTTDLIGLPRPIAEEVAAQAQKQYGLKRSALLLNASHTHTGPALPGNLDIMFDLDKVNRERIQSYGRRIVEDLVTVIGAAMGNMDPAILHYSSGKASFAANRREPTAEGIKLGFNPDGPTDHEVPVLRVSTTNGLMRAILFGYACHNTTLTGNDYLIHGDYAGHAQMALEQANPQTTALFLALCGADQNPKPRGTMEAAEENGKDLAEAVLSVLGRPMKPVRGPLRSAFKVVHLPLKPHTPGQFEPLKDDRDRFVRNHARAMLEAYEEGHPIRQVPYPVQAIRLGGDLTVLALGGEVVVDYALLFKQKYGASSEPLIVAGYSNDVMCYIPSKRVLAEGGYEADRSMIYYGMPGPFTEEVEDRVSDAVRDVLGRVGRRGR